VGRVRRSRSIWVGIVVVVVFFTGVTLAVAWLGGGPDIPHPVSGEWAACATCHPAASLPDAHADRVVDGCRSCHSEADAVADFAAVGAANTGPAAD
jgi:hypothetical protein